MLPRLLAYGVFLLALSGAPAASRAEQQMPTEYDVKAAFIYNFAKFVEWPAEKAQGDATMNVCVVGRDPFGPALDAIAGKSVGDRKIRIRRLASQSPQGCDIIFISGSERDRLEQVLEPLRGAGVLTIGDTHGFAQRGVMINFYMDGKRVRFEINPRAASRAGLRISSNLLKIARIVGAP